MAQQLAERNPFMLMINPEVVLEAMERSERLGKLNRHLCRPLDRPAPGVATGGAPVVDMDESDGETIADVKA
ncbi:MAG: hypothetical protein JNM33_03155 [Rubrivivax sp.]|nr:hypothetical protein [Rubrivivax sp.]